MKKNIFKKALSIITAVFVGIMSMPFIPSSAAAEVYTADMVITEASATPFTFEASKNIIETGETLLVSIYDTSTGEKWDGEELPEYVIEDESVLSVSAGESNGTFVITGLTAGTTYIRFTNEASAYADFKITVKQAPTGSTTAVAMTTMSFEPASPQLAVGETITIDMYDGIGDDPYTGSFPIYIIDNPSIVSIAPGQTESTLEMTGLSAGTTKIHFVPMIGTADMRVTVTEDGAVTVTTVNTNGGKLDDLTCTPSHSEAVIGDVMEIKITWPSGESYDGEALEIQETTPGCIDIAASDSPDTLLVTAVRTGYTTVFVRTPDGEAGFFTVDVGTGGTTTIQDYIGMSFETSSPVLGLGETISINMFEDYNRTEEYTGDFPEYTMDTPGIVSIAPGETESVLEMTALSVGTTRIRFFPGVGYADMFVTVTEDGTVTTTTTATTTTVTTDTDYLYTTTDYAIQLACSEENVTLYPGHTQSFYLYYKTGPTSFSESYPVTFEFENEGIAAVTPDPDAGTSDYIIEALAEGTTKLTIKQQYGNDTLICEMNVTVKAHEITDVTTTTTTSCTLTTIGLELDRTELEVMIGEEEAVNIIVEGGGNPPSFVIEDESIAAVVTSDDRSVFYVQGLAEGTTTIKVTDGDMHSVYLKVTVVSAEATTAPTETTTTTTTTLPVMGIVLSRSEIQLEAGQRTGIHISKTDGSDYFDGYLVECTSDNPAVAVVQTSDIPYTIYVVGMAEGTANITVYDPAFGSTAMLKVTVTGTADNTIGKDVSIVIDSLPQKLQYNIGEELDLTGGMYRVVNDSTGDDIYGPYDMTTGRIMTDAFDSTTAGTYPVYISYNNPIYGYWDVYVFYVTVNDPDAVNTGDIDANGKIDLDDAVAALTCYANTAAGIATTTPPEADVDGNGKVDLDDAVYILTYYARNAAGLPCTWDEIITG